MNPFVKKVSDIMNAATTLGREPIAYAKNALAEAQLMAERAAAAQASNVAAPTPKPSGPKVMSPAEVEARTSYTAPSPAQTPMGTLDTIYDDPNATGLPALPADMLTANKGTARPSSAPPAQTQTFASVPSLSEVAPVRASAQQPQGGGQQQLMPSNPIAVGVIETANALGISPIDLATIISYETAGTFDPTKAGPTTQWGQHRGLIQFGEPQAKQHGVDWNDPIGSQLGAGRAVYNYLYHAGVRPGMGILDVYSAVNAGRVGRYNASDANNGGAPGTVRDKVNNQMSGHRRNAMKLLGITGDGDMPANTQYAVGPQGDVYAQATSPGQGQGHLGYANPSYAPPPFQIYAPPQTGDEVADIILAAGGGAQDVDAVKQSIQTYVDDAAERDRQERRMALITTGGLKDLL